MKQVYRCCLRVLSPVHIGCDEVYEPTGFVLDEQAQELVTFDPLDFIESLESAEKMRFRTICSQGSLASLLEIYKFMRGRMMDGNRVGVCRGLVAHYQRTLSLSPRDRRRLQNELNNFVVMRTAFEPLTQRPYIPGSAVKGAFRTAYLNRLAQGAPRPVQPRGGKPAERARSLEQQLLDGGRFATDPFRLLKVSDFTAVGPVTTRIVYAVNRKKKPSSREASGPYQILEVVEPGAVFEGTITVDEAQPRCGIRRPLRLDAVLKSGANFFSGEWRREQDELSRIGVGETVKAVNGNAIRLRIGRHSGAESVTIDGYRRIFIMKGRDRRDGRVADHATTLWLAAESANPTTNRSLRPFGWIGLEEASQEELERLREIHRRRRMEEKEVKRQKELQHLEKKERAESKSSTVSKPPAPVVWDGAQLSWNPGNQEITAVHQKDKAFVTGSDLLPEALRARLLPKKKRKKPVKARVTVEPVGNGFRIVAIEDV